MTGQFGWTANMERIMKAQALKDNSNMDFMKGKKHLEINPSHPIIKCINERLNSDSTDELIYLLYETSLLDGGFSLADPNLFTSRLHHIIELGLSSQPKENNDTEITDKEQDNSHEEKVSGSPLKNCETINAEPATENTNNVQCRNNC